MDAENTTTTVSSLNASVNPDTNACANAEAYTSVRDAPEKEGDLHASDASAEEIGGHKACVENWEEGDLHASDASACDSADKSRG